MMEDFVVKKNSWHYRFVSKYLRDVGLSERTRPKDFCSYWKLFLEATLLHILLVILFAFMMVTVGLVLYGIGFYFVYVFGLSHMVYITPLVLFMIAIFFFFTHKTETSDKSNGLFRAKYRSWKEKICPRITYEDV